jgi:transposase, IS30 family
MYTQLTQEQRYQIHALLKMEHSRTEIANTLGVHKSTISRELQRNRGKRGYRPKQAHQFALQRRKKARARITADIWAMVEEKLRQDWSPEQIAGRFKEEGIAISHEHIYQYVYTDKRVGGDLWKHLRCHTCPGGRCQGKKRRKRVGDYDRRGKIPNRKSIEERPEVVEQRTRLGDWEVDLMLGKDHQGVLVTLTERKSRFTLLRKVANKQAQLVSQAIVELLQWISTLESITADNGKEFAAHQHISQMLSVDFYFAHPYSSWERGTNENTNGLIRQYVPKSHSLKNISFQEETMIMDRLNLRPRKCLDFRTPFEVFFEHQPVALAT